MLPRDLMSGTYTKPKCYLCETNKEKICPLETTNMQGTFKFNSYSELSFDVARFYNDVISGDIRINPYYDKLEAVRLVYLEGFGYFELQDPSIVGDGIKEVKSLSANSLEYTLTQKYIEDLYVNTGEINSVEVMVADDRGTTIIPVTLCNDSDHELSLLHLILERVYGWNVGHVDDSLKTLSRQFEVDRTSVYDFIINEICEKFNCYAMFDTEENTINLYAETRTVKFAGNNKVNTFYVSPVFKEIGTVSVGGYKTTNYEYNESSGELVLGDTPGNGVIIEVTDGALSDWETDVYVTFDNLAQEMNISYSADDIKTVLTVTGADDLDIREVNNGLPYIVDLSYFYSVDWMGQDLYDAYKNYLSKSTTLQEQYKINSQKILEYSNQILYEQYRVSLEYSEVSGPTSELIGTYYVRGGDEATGYYYNEVTLPADWKADTTYYSTRGSDINEDIVGDLYAALKTYYKAYCETERDTGVGAGDISGFEDEESTLKDDFNFMESPSFDDLVTALKNNNDPDGIVLKFFCKMWEPIGTKLLNNYLKVYKDIQTTNVSAGWSERKSDDYGLYYPVLLIIESIETTIAERQKKIDELTAAMKACSVSNAEIANDLLIDNNFDDDQKIRLSAFLREDKYTDDTFLETGEETTEELFQIKQELLECGRIELSKICEPALKFSMSLANIYALPEFAPIMSQFKLGNLIKVALRSDYVKHARLMQVNLNFEDFSDFSCEFGDLASIRSQSDLHADLLSQAVSAGKSVASSASYWNKGTDTATAIDVSIQQGLLDAAISIKSINATQSVEIDDYGIHLLDRNPRTGEVSPEQGWIVNNKFLYSDDGFKTTKSVFGKYEINGQTKWGLLSDAVVAGDIIGSRIVGGTIQIGDLDQVDSDGNPLYNFEVDHDGYITMRGGKGFTKNGDEVNLAELWTHVRVLDDGLHLIAPSDEGVFFESVLTSTQLTFRSNSGGTEQDVVWLGTDTMSAINVNAFNYINVQSKDKDSASPYIELGNFKLQIEDNKSLSII